MSGRVALYSSLTGRRPLANLTSNEAVTIGRSSQADVVIAHPSVSRRHCEIAVLVSDHLRVRDLGSSNGTWYGGRRIEEAAIPVGATFRVGQVELIAFPDSPRNRALAGSTATTHRLAPPDTSSKPKTQRTTKVAKSGDIVRLLAELVHELGLRTAVLLGANRTKGPIAAEAIASYPQSRWCPPENALRIVAGAARGSHEHASGSIVLPGGEAVSVLVHKLQRSGLLLYIERPGEGGAILPPVLNRVRDVADRLDKELSGLLPDAPPEPAFPELIGGEALEAVRRFIAVAAGSDCPVLVTGETGTGKELVATLIHTHSRRASGPFVEVNCAALSETLLESELFGHEKGAFTGAVSTHRGVFERGHSGSVFLDEIGDMSLAAQSRLLRVLETGSLTRVGGERIIHVDTRVIAATNRNLVAAVREGAFREDLFFRLNVLTVELPPLRDRGDDVILLARHFLHDLACRYGRPGIKLTRAAERKLRAYHWPGNVRELRHTLEAAFLLSSGTEITAEDIRFVGARLSIDDLRVDDVASLSYEEVQRKHLESVLRATGGNKSEAARRLQIPRTRLYNLLNRFGLR